MILHRLSVADIAKDILVSTGRNWVAYDDTIIRSIYLEGVKKKLMKSGDTDVLSIRQKVLSCLDRSEMFDKHIMDNRRFYKLKTNYKI
jgi:hypothetical protein